jgi:hypothetical protein
MQAFDWFGEPWNVDTVVDSPLDDLNPPTQHIEAPPQRRASKRCKPRIRRSWIGMGASNTNDRVCRRDEATAVETRRAPPARPPMPSLPRFPLLPPRKTSADSLPSFPLLPPEPRSAVPKGPAVRLPRFSDLDRTGSPDQR